MAILNLNRFTWQLIKLPLFRPRSRKKNRDAQCGESPKMWKKYKNRKSATGGTKVNLENIEFTIQLTNLIFHSIVF